MHKTDVISFFTHSNHFIPTFLCSVCSVITYLSNANTYNSTLLPIYLQCYELQLNKHWKQQSLHSQSLHSPPFEQYICNANNLQCQQLQLNHHWEQQSPPLELLATTIQLLCKDNHQLNKCTLISPNNYTTAQIMHISLPL